MFALTCRPGQGCSSIITFRGLVHVILVKIEPQKSSVAGVSTREPHLFSILLIVIVIINPSSKHGDYMITAPNQAHVYYNAFTTQQCYNYAIRENFNTSGHITCQNQLMHTTYTAHIL